MKMKKWHVRISVTPLCNFRCRYCNPYGLREKGKFIDEKDIVFLLRAFYAAGVERVHWTGGEPGVVKLNYLVKEAKSIGYSDQIVTTNSVLIKDNIQELITNGLNRFNVSIDSLDKECYKQIAGADALDDALEALDKILKNTSSVTKINIVALNHNIHELHGFVEFARKKNSDLTNRSKIVLKIIELCPNNPAFFENEKSYDLKSMHVSRSDIIKEIEKKFQLEPTTIEGDNPNCDYYLLKDTNVNVGLVTMPSLNYPCGGHNNRKLRINPYGVIGACLAKPAFNFSEFSFDDLVYKIKNLILFREQETEADFKARKHYQGNFGIWRFGDCNK